MKRLCPWVGPASTGALCLLSFALLSLPAAAAPEPPPDPCDGIPRCTSSGPFIAHITAVTAQGGPRDRHHVLKLTVRFRNVSTEPIVLGYKSNTSMATDNLGNAYVFGRPGTVDNSSSGIGRVTPRQADTSFVLQPGESRDAAFTVVRYNSLGKQLGTAWVYDVVINQLEVLPAQQVRTVRENSLHFARFAAGATAADLREAIDGLKNVFKKK